MGERLDISLTDSFKRNTRRLTLGKCRLLHKTDNQQQRDDNEFHISLCAQMIGEAKSGFV